MAVQKRTVGRRSAKVALGLPPDQLKSRIAAGGEPGNAMVGVSFDVPPYHGTVRFESDTSASVSPAAIRQFSA